MPERYGSSAGKMQLNEDQKQIIRNAGKVWILGGENAVSAAVKTAVDEEIS
jgi:hypothetical protein